MGVASAGNIPGARAAAATYTDGQGALWLFGGYGYDSVGSNPSSTTSFLSDLWKYDPAAGAWTWVNGSKIANVAGVYGAKGSAAPDNAPGGRIYAASWTDKQGNFWLFGGAGYISNVVTSADLNDLWKYNPTTNQWTWVSGANVAKTNGVYGMKAIPSPSNMPGAREGAVSWRDAAGALWLFGGYGYGSAGGLADLNDLWKYEPARDAWTWISGDDVGSSPGAYGEPGIPASGNVPGARRFASAWADSNGSFWMFGGNGYDSLGNFTTLNDLWKFNPATAEWTWVSGSTTGNAPGNYGAQDMASPSNVPGARDQAAGWRDGNGKFWIYGGIDFSSTPSNRVSLNDLWKFDPATTQWTWVRGANTPNALGVYGTLGLAAIGNAPGARQLSAAWVDGSNTLWLFGGYGLDSINTTAKSLNDLWFIVPQ